MKDGKTWGILNRRSEAATRAIENLNLTPTFPINIMIELSNACNHACVFCSNPKMTRPRRRIDTGLLQDILRQAYALGTREVGFYTTGDPLIHRDLESFIRFAKEVGYRYTYISTNGGLATHERLKNIIDAGLDSIKFSINAGTRESYAAIHGKDDWEKVISNVKFVSEYRRQNDLDLKIGITYVTMPYNAHEKDALRDLLGPSVDDIYFSPSVSNQGGYMPENKILASEEFTLMPASKCPCFMLFNRMHVTCEGYMTLCCVDYQGYLTLADLKETPLKEAWHSPAFQAVRQRHLDNKLEGTLCFNCVNNVATKVEPLDPALAFNYDFEKGSEANSLKQQTRIPLAS